MLNGWRKIAQAQLERLGMTPAEFGRRVAQSEGKSASSKTIYRDYFLGQPEKGKPPSEPTVERAKIFAHVLGLSLATLFDDGELSRLAISINGIAKGGDGMWLPVPAEAMRSVPLNMLLSDVSVVLVEDSEHEPHYRRGDILCGPVMTGRGVDNLINRDCIIETVDGAKFIKHLMKGGRPGRYLLRSIKLGKDDLSDVREIGRAHV